MASGDARPIPRKNVAYRVTFPIFDADGDLVTGAAGLDSEVSKDAGTFADCTNEATEIASSSGMYYLDLTATEMNADTVAVLVKTSTSGAKTTPIVLYPEEAGDIRVNVSQWKDATAPDNTGDAYAIVNNGTYGNAAIENLVDDLESRLTATRAAYLDNLSGGAVGLASELAKVPKSDSTVSWNATALAAMATQAQTGLTAQGYTTTRAGYLDTLNGLVAAIWNALTSGLTTAGSIGKLLVDNINATISSRSTYAGGDTSGVTTLLSRIVGTIAAGTHNPQSGDAYGVVNNGTYGNSAIETLVDELESRLTATRAGYLDNLSGGAAATAAALATVDGIVDKLDTAMEADGGVYRFTANALEQAPTGGSAPTAAAVADAVLEELVSDHSGVSNSLANVISLIYTLVGNTNVIAGKLDTAVELDGAVYRLTANALEQAPAGSGLTAQQVRDAMKLAPTAGAPDEDSIDEILQDIAPGVTAAGLMATAWAGMVEDDGSGGSQYTALALENAPAGGTGLDAAGVRAAIGLASANLDTQLATIDGNVDAILADTGTDGVAVATSSKSGYALSTSGNNSVVAALFAAISEGTETFIESFRLIRALAAGKTSGGGTGTHRFRDAADTKNRIQATVDANGNRSVVTTDGS